MTRSVLCFGDSNTHGSVPNGMPDLYERFGPETRWPRIAGSVLGAGWEIVEEGLPGRTAQFDDPEMGGFMDGRIGLKMALHSHGPLDAMTVMLGTNDVKTRFEASPEQVTEGMSAVLDIALSAEVQGRHGGFKLLLICPPPVREIDLLSEQFLGGPVKAEALPALYQQLAQDRGVEFLNAGDVIEASLVDGIHFEADAHVVFGQAVAARIAAL